MQVTEIKITDINTSNQDHRHQYKWLRSQTSMQVTEIKITDINASDWDHRHQYKWLRSQTSMQVTEITDIHANNWDHRHPCKWLRSQTSMQMTEITDITVYLLALFKSLTNSADCLWRTSELREIFSNVATSSCTRLFRLRSRVKAAARSGASSDGSRERRSATVMGTTALSHSCNTYTGDGCNLTVIPVIHMLH